MYFFNVILMPNVAYLCILCVLLLGYVLHDVESAVINKKLSQESLDVCQAELLETYI